MSLTVLLLLCESGWRIWNTNAWLRRWGLIHDAATGLRVSTRALLITSSIENVVQLRAVIAAGTVAMNEKHYQQRFNAQALD